MAERLRYFIPEEELNTTSAELLPTSPLQEPGDRKPNVISSLTEAGLHRPVIDIDFPARLVPSSTEGHFHLYLDGINLSWGKYAVLIMALEDAGIIGKGYASRSLEREQTIVRLPHSRKPVQP